MARITRSTSSANSRQMISSRLPARSGPMARTLGGSASGSRSMMGMAWSRACLADHRVVDAVPAGRLVALRI